MKQIHILIISSVFAVLLSPARQTSAAECYPQKVSVEGSQISGHIELTAGQKATITADFAGDCSGKKAEFRVCYPTYDNFLGTPDFSCDEAGTTFDFLGSPQNISNNKASIEWQAQKNRTNETKPQTIQAREINGSVVRQSLPIVVLGQNEETECRLRGLTASISSGRANLAATTNSRCEGRDVYFFICSQNARGVQDCNTNFGQVKTSGGTVKISNPIPSAFSGNTSIFFRASIGNQTVDSRILSNQDFIGGVGTGGGEPISFKFKLKNYLIGDPKDIGGVLGLLGRFIFNLGIPLAVIIIIYGGLIMLTSGGSPNQYKKGLEALKWAVIGLAVLLIGKGFVSLVQSILSIK